MRQQAEERARERKNRPPGTRPIGPRPQGAARYGARDSGPRPPGPSGPRASRYPGAPSSGPRYPGTGPRPAGPPGRLRHGSVPPHSGPARAPHSGPPRAPYSGPQRPPRQGVRYAPPVREQTGGAPTRHERRPVKPFRTGVQSAGDGPPRPVPAPEEPPLARVLQLLSGYQQSAVLIAAHALGVFPEIQKRPQVAADVARHCGLDPRGAELLLDALVAHGVLNRHGSTYVLPREIAPYLIPGPVGDASGMVEAAAELYDVWGDLPRAIREGTPRHRLSTDALLTGDPSRVRRYIRAVHTVSREAAERLTELAPLLPGSSFLDVGGGSGVFGAEYARRTPDLQATLFDLPPTIEVAREILRAEGYEDNVMFHPGDYRSDPLPGPVDTLLLSNVLQTESEEQALGILHKAWEAIRPGGTLLIHGTMPDSSGSLSSNTALFALRMYLIFDGGRAWSVEQVTEWLAAERFAVRATRPLGNPFQTKLILASRLE
jgi:SAM-dependent methyltransferase